MDILDVGYTTLRNISSTSSEDDTLKIRSELWVAHTVDYFTFLHLRVVSSRNMRLGQKFSTNLHDSSQSWYNIVNCLISIVSCRYIISVVNCKYFLLSMYIN